jgi:hypothetical protein
VDRALNAGRSEEAPAEREFLNPGVDVGTSKEILPVEGLLNSEAVNGGESTLVDEATPHEGLVLSLDEEITEEKKERELGITSAYDGPAPVEIASGVVNEPLSKVDCEVINDEAGNEKKEQEEEQITSTTVVDSAAIDQPPEDERVFQPAMEKTAGETKKGKKEVCYITSSTLVRRRCALTRETGETECNVSLPAISTTASCGGRPFQIRGYPTEQDSKA